ncbi:class I SAM-dependent methyltransferase [Staphylococcus sp. HKU1]|uniref:class I SAM-dependent methyltransferase n=1 Tax=Staphylococcus sp. HKU1 TaxID=3068989 RepID=UPI003AAFB947
MKEFFQSLHTPERFSPSPQNIWTEEKISPFIFQSYFNNDVYGGSKDDDFLKKSISFIDKIATRNSCTSILDLGCGPGIYCSPLFDLGYTVSGMDISQKAISYAQEYAKKNHQDISYYNNDILTVDLEEKYDMVILLYEIFSSFSLDNRKKVLKKIYNTLDTNGIFIFDVPSEKRYIEHNPMKIWEIFKPGDILLKETCYYFFSTEQFSQNLLFNHSVFLFENSEIVNCYDWIQCFDKKMLFDELSQNGFNILKVYSNTCGDELKPESHSIALICQKKY